MNDRQPKEHTAAYLYLKAIADRLHSMWAKVQELEGRNADLVRQSVGRKLCRDWDDAIVNALNANYSPADIRAAVTRLKDGKGWLNYLDEFSTRRAA